MFLSTSAGQARALRVAFPNVQVSRDQYAAHSEPTVAENPKNRLNLVAGSKMFTDPAHYKFKIGTYYSLDGGQSWHDNGFLPGFSGWATTSDISLAFSQDGVCYAVVLALNGKESGIFVSRSADEGKTFSAPVPVFVDATGKTFSDKPWIVVDRSSSSTVGNVYVAWNLDESGAKDPDGKPRKAMRPRAAPSVPGTGMVVSRSTNSGKSFSPPVVMQPFNNTEFPLGAIPQVGPDGRLTVIYSEISDRTGRVNQMTMAQSTDGGVSFSVPRVVMQVEGLPNHLPNGTFRNLSLPSFAVSRKDGVMVMVWSDVRYGDADILASTSTDNGVTWSQPVRVNHDKVSNGKDQFQPEVAVAPNGTFTCAWFDRRHDSANRLINLMIAQSADGGRTWSTNLKVTDRAWDPTIDAPRPDKDNSFIGDYQGLAVDNRTVHPLWNDTQNGTSQQIRTAGMAVTVFAR